MPRLEVKVGPDRFNMEPCRVNDSHRPFEINTEHFVGRVFVRILNHAGAQQGEEGREYFRDRSRKFCIQIEGRFTKPWNGNEVLFGTDFDKLIDFPRAPFNAGMKVAQFIDPCTFYEEKPGSGRPYIMSPYIACMNTVAAWPAPDRECDAVVVLRDVVAHDGEDAGTPKRNQSPAPAVFSEGKNELSASPTKENPTAVVAAEDDIVPVESIERQVSQEDAKSKKRKSWFGGFGGKKEDERKPKRYWRFIGFKTDARVRAFLEAHDARLEVESAAKPPKSENSGTASPPNANASEVQHAPGRPMISRLGTFSRKELSTTPRESSATGTPDLSATDSGLRELGEEIAALDLNGPKDENGKPMMPRLERIPTDVRTEMQQAAKRDGLQSKDFKLAGELHHSKMGRTDSADGWSSKLEDQLGPWRFSDPSTDMLEDNAFIFTNQSLPVPRRRKHFSNLKNRLDFKYDPDVVYATSFFTDMADLTTMDLSVGPVHLNIGRFFKEMPIRYTLRAADENITFATISFQLVDN
ncbi:unnamed protein product [Tilletia controversa]|nr:hypothetical protein CF336_g5511 [Tilletia laevis]KAE8193386.1 hypothetical protein CF328_g5065 [Tilletia controversa]CAD6896415.1 unnamed protein product [Tilletia laevis]CAD6923814.1 unnamed protein product [Tilletia controversa]CAD6955946.1 unnamed protein product [Tilletia controversa]